MKNQKMTTKVASKLWVNLIIVTFISGSIAIGFLALTFSALSTQDTNETDSSGDLPGYPVECPAMSDGPWCYGYGDIAWYPNVGWRYGAPGSLTPNSPIEEFARYALRECQIKFNDCVSSEEEEWGQNRATCEEFTALVCSFSAQFRDRLCEANLVCEETNSRGVLCRYNDVEVDKEGNITMGKADCYPKSSSAPGAKYCSTIGEYNYYSYLCEQ